MTQYHQEWRDRFEAPEQQYERQYVAQQQQQVVPPVQTYVPIYTVSTPRGESETRLLAVGSYMLGWFSGIVCLFFGHRNPFVRFHALQSTLFFGLATLFDVAFVTMFGLFDRWDLFPRGFLGGFYALALFFTFLIVNMLVFIGWIVGIVQAARGEYYKFPVVGNIAAKASSDGAIADVK
ncbi:putative membrane protein [Thermosporothrix hazakensis]|jgi:uncharacterized membrane protein|nr:hypothetical protein [Thermosporothrix hazakensis]PZW30565.1 putative membrane protein [Thermosporothrix hazakensis]